MFGDHWLLGLVIIGLLLRCVLALALDANLFPVGDEGMYSYRAALWRATGHLHTGAFVRPPLYFAVVAAVQAVAAELSLSWTLLLRLLQSLVGAALAFPVYRTARRVAGVRAARIAVGIVMLDPTLIAYSHLLWPATLYTLIVAIVFDAILDLERGHLWHQALIGVLIGAALLLKPVFGLFALLLALFWLARLRVAQTAKLVAVVGGTAALVIAPWVARNMSRYGPAILIENQAPYNLWVGNADIPAPHVLKRWVALGDPVERSRAGLRNGFVAISDDPKGFAKRSGVRALNLWGFEFFIVRHFIMGGYAGTTKTTFVGLFWAIQCLWFATLVLTGAGLARAWRDPPLRLLWIFAFIFTVIVSAMTTTTRFRVPFALPVAVTAALGVQALCTREGRRVALAGLAAALLLLTVSVSKPSFRKIAAARYDSPRELSNPDWYWFRY
jgi:4-amino-4-deoxy-L-arabinose transferase-like glycosyltransferase